MNAFARMPRVARAALLGACLVGAVALAAGCSKKLTSIDPSYTTPEGVATGSAKLVVYPVLPFLIDVWQDNAPLGVLNPTTGTPDVFLFTLAFTQGPANLRQGAIVDGTPAYGFQIMRREANGGLRSVGTEGPTRRWMETQNELYLFSDDQPGGYTPPTYVGRGLIQGVVAQRSPVTNESVLGTQVALGTNTTPHLTSDALGRPDSLFTITWDPIAGAAGYWVEVYQGMSGEQLVVTTPSPFQVSALDDYVAFVPATATSVQIGSNPGQLVSFRSERFQPSGDYGVRVSAVDANGTMTGFLGVSAIDSTSLVLDDGEYHHVILVGYPFDQVVHVQKPKGSSPRLAATPTTGGMPHAALADFTRLLPGATVTRLVGLPPGTSLTPRFRAQIGR